MEKSDSSLEPGCSKTKTVQSSANYKDIVEISSDNDNSLEISSDDFEMDILNDEVKSVDEVCNDGFNLIRNEEDFIVEISSDEYDEDVIISDEEARYTAELIEEGLPDLSERNTTANKTNKVKKALFQESFTSEHIENKHNIKQETIDNRNLPSVLVTKKNEAIKKLFPPIKSESNPGPSREILTEGPDQQTVGTTVHEMMIAGVNVKLPVNPYRSQVVLMNNLIQTIKNSKNCILESPTGSGKTLALLCGALAWQEHEKNIAQESERLNNEPLLNSVHSMVINSPSTSKQDVTPEKLFTKTNFGDKNIYQKPVECGDPSTPNFKRSGPYINDSYGVSPPASMVNIHKKPRHNFGNSDVSMAGPSNQQVTPEKGYPVENEVTPETKRQTNDKVQYMSLRSVPTIYYGARTHTQLQQVIKEFRRTAYCGRAKMTLLSSRNKTCIKQFDIKKWKSKDDMCRDCTKQSNLTENCEYYNNRRDITHDILPDAFDLEDLLDIGQKTCACPYYGARALAKTSDIVFCPYNYLIDPAIRNNLQINLEGCIIVIDEAHNIEAQCREAASLSLTKNKVQDSLLELETAAHYRFAIRDVETYIDSLIASMRNWRDWFQNQIPLLITKKIADNNKVIHSWEVDHFLQTLENHNIGYTHYNTFRVNSEEFCRRMRDDPRPFLGVTQSTCNVLEALSTHLGYLFRDNLKHTDDFKPALEAKICDAFSKKSSYSFMGRSRDAKTEVSKVQDETLHLYCLNSGIVMSSLHIARCIALASGTLSPMGSISAELDTEFHTIRSAQNMINDKVWGGIVTGDNNDIQEYKHIDLQNHFSKDRLGNLILTVCDITPNGVICFVSSYHMLNNCIKRWQNTGVWQELNKLKHIFCEQRTAHEHETMMKQFYKEVSTDKGALLIAVYRGKVSEGMDFKDHQARAVICVGIPYLNRTETAIGAKVNYNDAICNNRERYQQKQLLNGNAWLKIQTYRALNQALGRCVRHKEDWGAVLLVDNRYTKPENTEHLSKWVKEIIKKEPYTCESLRPRTDGLFAFMKRMKSLNTKEEK